MFVNPALSETMSEKNKQYIVRMNESSSTTGAHNRGDLYDMELVVEGKQVKANSGLLSCSSSVFATLISNARATQADDNDVTDRVTQRARSVGPLERKLKLEMPNLLYKDVKTMIACLQDSGELTGDKALRILPLVDHFRMSHLRKACGTALQNSVDTMRKQQGSGRLQSRDVLKYLSSADTYRFDKVRKICIEELVVNTNVSRRKEILHDKHISEKTKLNILDKMCDKLDNDYEVKLKMLRTDMDKRCREIEKRRDEFLEELETWKTDLRQETENVVKTNSDKAHKRLVDDMHQKKIADRIDDASKQTKNELLTEMEQLRDQMNMVYETMETNEIIDYEEAITLKETLEKALSSNTSNIESITDAFKRKMDRQLRVCSFYNEVEGGFASSYELEQSVCRTIEELEDNVQELSVYQTKFEEEKMAHEKTRSELLKLKVRDHEINTWLKWAKPVSEDEEKCMCFRHTVLRK